MFFVIRIGLLQFTQNLGLFHSSAVPVHAISGETGGIRKEDGHGFLAPDDLNRNLFAALASVLKNAGSHDICKHSLSERREDLVTTTV
jgi:hypothetical protein